MQLPYIKFLPYGEYADMNMALDNIVPETLDWLHTDEGPE